MLSFEEQQLIKSSFKEGTLEIRSVSPEGDLTWKRIQQVFKHKVPFEDILEIETTEGNMTLTGRHRVFTSPTTKKNAEELRPGDSILSVQKGEVTSIEVVSTQQKSSRTYMYDLTAEDWHNFLLEDSKAIISNSPDRNYRFRPPEHEGDVKAFNQIFGYIWEDDELLIYIEAALDWFNSMPPQTSQICTIEQLVQQRPSWKTAIMWGAIAHAATALSFNWAAESFSIKGNTEVTIYLEDGEPVSLPIEELWEICHGSSETKIKQAFKSGQLKTKTVDRKTGAVNLKVVSNILKHTTPNKPCVLLQVESGEQIVCTIDHSVFLYTKGSIEDIKAGKLNTGDIIAFVNEDSKVVEGRELTVVTFLEPEEFTYDLSVPGPENFVLSNGILAHNSYSIGGISLDIDKSSTYESLKQNAESQLDKATEAKARTEKYTSGLKQPRFGLGVRSSLGPAVGKGVLSPRNFTGL